MWMDGNSWTGVDLDFKGYHILSKMQSPPAEEKLWKSNLNVAPEPLQWLVLSHCHYRNDKLGCPHKYTASECSNSSLELLASVWQWWRANGTSTGRAVGEGEGLLLLFLAVMFVFVLMLVFMFLLLLLVFMVVMMVVLTMLGGAGLFWKTRQWGRGHGKHV